jgi:tetratricopeptide (TPR) repeat protein
VYLHIGLLDKAQEEIEKALAINPGNTLARYRLGVIDMCRGRYQEAFQIFNSTPLEQNPSLLAFYTSNALFRLGRNEEASVLIERFLKDYPKDEG